MLYQFVALHGLILPDWGERYLTIDASYTILTIFGKIFDVSMTVKFITLFFSLALSLSSLFGQRCADLVIDEIKVAPKESFYSTGSQKQYIKIKNNGYQNVKLRKYRIHTGPSYVKSVGLVGRVKPGQTKLFVLNQKGLFWPGIRYYVTPDTRFSLYCTETGRKVLIDTVHVKEMEYDQFGKRRGDTLVIKKDGYVPESQDDNFDENDNRGSNGNGKLTERASPYEDFEDPNYGLELGASVGWGIPQGNDIFQESAGTGPAWSIHGRSHTSWGIIGGGVYANWMMNWYRFGFSIEEETSKGYLTNSTKGIHTYGRLATGLEAFINFHPRVRLTFGQHIIWTTLNRERYTQRLYFEDFDGNVILDQEEKQFVKADFGVGLAWSLDLAYKLTSESKVHVMFMRDHARADLDDTGAVRNNLITVGFSTEFEVSWNALSILQILSWF